MRVEEEKTVLDLDAENTEWAPVWSQPQCRTAQHARELRKDDFMRL